jgi:FtsZ-binding cell division protein ZapB
MRSITRQEIVDLIQETVHEELKKRMKVKETKEKYGSLSGDVEELQTDLNDLNTMLDTLKQFMVRLDGMDDRLDNVKKRSKK